MRASKIKNMAVLIGYNRDGKCVYSDLVDLSTYYDSEHVWDNATTVKRLKLSRVKGYLFNSDGVLDQEFESIFDPVTGRYKRGEVRFADGTTTTD